MYLMLQRPLDKWIGYDFVDYAVGLTSKLLVFVEGNFYRVWTQTQLFVINGRYS